MSKYIDFKCTTWERVYVSDDADIQKIKEILQNDDDPLNELYNRNIAIYNEFLIENSELMTLEENDNQSTIEFYDNGGVLLYHNGNC